MSGSGARLLIGSLVGPAAAVNSVAFSPDGKTLAAGSADGTVRFWNVATQQSAGGSLIDRQARGVLSLAFSPDGKTVATGNTDGSVRLWDAATRRPIGVPFIADAGQVNSVAFSPDGKILASGSYDLTIR
jgi:WD40 repeat protein